MNICFLPGSMCDARVFGPQIAAATRAGHYCNVLDLTTTSTIESMASHVVASTPQGVVLVGISMGAIVAAEAVVQAPGHAGAIALIDTNLDAPGDEQLTRRRRWAQDARCGGFADMVSNNLTDALTLFPQRNSEVIFDMAMATKPSGFLRQNDALLNRRDRRDDLADFGGPVLILCGADDHVCPPSLHAELAARIPHVTQRVIADAGHLSTIDQPDDVNTAFTDWLTFCNQQIQSLEGTHEHPYA